MNTEDHFGGVEMLFTWMRNGKDPQFSIIYGYDLAVAIFGQKIQSKDLEDRNVEMVSLEGKLNIHTQKWINLQKGCKKIVDIHR